jgi:DNA-binding transcriptional LysR family regulator
MDLHKLRIFVAIARTGSFTRAAEQLYMTQPTISQQLAQLEADIGTPLIERRPRQQRLTPAGEALLPYAEQMMGLATAAADAARCAAGLAERTLRLGVGHVLATYLLPDLLQRYRGLYPQHQVSISVGNTAELIGRVAAGAVDLGLIGTPVENPDVEYAQFMADRLVAVVARDDMWAERSSVEPDELRTRTLLTREPGSALYASVERLLGIRIAERSDTIVLAESEAIKRCVEAGIGVAIIQSIAVQREVEQGILRALELRGGDNQRRYVYAWRRHASLNYATQAMIALLASGMAQALAAQERQIPT